MKVACSTPIAVAGYPTPLGFSPIKTTPQKSSALLVRGELKSDKSCSDLFIIALTCNYLVFFLTFATAFFTTAFFTTVFWATAFFGSVFFTTAFFTTAFLSFDLGAIFLAVEFFVEALGSTAFLAVLFAGVAATFAEAFFEETAAAVFFSVIRDIS